MNILYAIFSNVSFVIALLWFFLFLYLGIKVFKNKFSVIDKELSHSRITSKSNFGYNKMFYLILLMFLLTESASSNNFISCLNVSDSSNYEWKNYQTFIVLEDIISLFTLFAFYFFVFSFFIAKENKERKYNWKMISFSIIFINLLFNLVLIPKQVFFLVDSQLLTINQLISFLVSVFIYILVLKFFVNLFKYSFNYSIAYFLKLTVIVFNYRTIKDIFIKKNKINVFNFLNQVWGLYSLVSENEKYYSLLEEKFFVFQVANNFEFSDNKVEKRNLSFFMFDKQTILLFYYLITSSKRIY